MGLKHSLVQKSSNQVIVGPKTRLISIGSQPKKIVVVVVVVIGVVVVVVVHVVVAVFLLFIPETYL